MRSQYRCRCIALVSLIPKRLQKHKQRRDRFLVVVVVVVVVGRRRRRRRRSPTQSVSHRFRWKTIRRDLCAPRDDDDLFARKKKTNTTTTNNNDTRSAAATMAQKTTTHLGVLPGDLFVELGLRAVPERGVSPCSTEIL